MCNKFFGLTENQWELLLAKVPTEVIETLNPLSIKAYCARNKISIPCDKIEHIIAEDVRPRNVYDFLRIVEKYESSRSFT